MIFSRTPPDVARAKIVAWQRTKQLKFFADLERLIVRHEGSGLEKRRIVETIGLTAKALEKTGR
jgi:hypothetical protein